MIDLYAEEKTLILIDGQSLRQTLTSLDVELDYKRLLRHVRSHSKLRRALFATVVSADETRASRAFTDWLDYNGFTLISRTTKAVVDANGVPHLRGDARVELAVATMELAGEVDHVLLFSSHSSLCCLVAALKRRGVRVTVISSLVARPGGVADDLRRAADSFVELLHLDQLFLERAKSAVGVVAEVPETVTATAANASEQVSAEAKAARTGFVTSAPIAPASNTPPLAPHPAPFAGVQCAASATVIAPASAADAMPASPSAATAVNVPPRSPALLPAERAAASGPPVVDAAAVVVEKRRRPRRLSVKS